MAKATTNGKSKALVPWKEKFAGYAKDTRKQVENVGGGVGIKFGRGSIQVGGIPVKGGKLECVIIGSCALNAWFEDDYNKDDVQPPDCYAFAINVGDEDMKPHEKAESPQHEDCAGCPQNQFGTAKTGKGKACSNRVRIGAIAAKDAKDADTVVSAQLAIGSVSPTNLKHWAAYVKLLDEMDGGPRQPWNVVTEIQSFDDQDTQIRLEFRLVETIDDGDILTALEKRYNKVQDALQVPYGPKIERAKGPAAGGSRKFAGAKKGGKK